MLRMFYLWHIPILRMDSTLYSVQIEVLIPYARLCLLLLVSGWMFILRFGCPVSALGRATLLESDDLRVRLRCSTITTPGSRLKLMTPMAFLLVKPWMLRPVTWKQPSVGGPLISREWGDAQPGELRSAKIYSILLQAGHWILAFPI